MKDKQRPDKTFLYIRIAKILITCLALSAIWLVAIW